MIQLTPLKGRQSKRNYLLCMTNIQSNLLEGVSKKTKKVNDDDKNKKYEKMGSFIPIETWWFCETSKL